MSLPYKTIGSPDSPHLIFIHGLGGGAIRTVTSFAHLKDRYLIAPDMPGHGDNQDASNNNLSFNNFADLVIELMDGLGIESCDIGGLSMGSGITLNLALRYPERIKKMILLRPSWLHEKEPEHLKLVAYVGQWIEQYGIDGARGKLHADPDFQQLASENKPVAGSIEIILGRPITPASTAVLYRMWQDSPFSNLSELSALPNPALVLTTTRDELHPISTANAIAAHLPNVQTTDLPARYHEPEAHSLALNTIVLKFLAE